MSDYGSDDYDYERERERRRRPTAHRYRSDRRSTHLAPDTNGLYRTRSQGHAPAPAINIYNDMQQEGSYRTSSRSPDYPPSPRGRRLGDDLADEFADLAMENRRLRSRSRVRSDASSRRDDYTDWKLRDERLKQEYELERAKEDAEKKRIIADYERKQREEEEERKEEEKRMREKIEREKIEAKEKEERQWNEFLRKQREKEDEDKQKKKDEEAKIEEEMRRRLSRNGYTYNQIERMIRDEKEEKSKTVTSTSLTTTRTLGSYGSHRPTYAKIHRDYLSIDTLTYYDIPYEWDRDDPNYIIILREMDKYETEVLFEHTKRLRAGKLLLEPAKEQKQYAWYRKRDRSSSRVRKVGILEFKK